MPHGTSFPEESGGLCGHVYFSGLAVCQLSANTGDLRQITRDKICRILYRIKYDAREKHSIPKGDTRLFALVSNLVEVFPYRDKNNPAAILAQFRKTAAGDAIHSFSNFFWIIIAKRVDSAAPFRQPSLDRDANACGTKNPYPIVSTREDGVN